MPNVGKVDELATAGSDRKPPIRICLQHQRFPSLVSGLHIDPRGDAKQRVVEYDRVHSSIDVELVCLDRPAPPLQIRGFVGPADLGLRLREHSERLLEEEQFDSTVVCIGLSGAGLTAREPLAAAVELHRRPRWHTRVVEPHVLGDQGLAGDRAGDAVGLESAGTLKVLQRRALRDLVGAFEDGVQHQPIFGCPPALLQWGRRLVPLQPRRSVVAQERRDRFGALQGEGVVVVRLSADVGVANDEQRAVRMVGIKRGEARQMLERRGQQKRAVGVEEHAADASQDDPWLEH